MWPAWWCLQKREILYYFFFQFVAKACKGERQKALKYILGLIRSQNSVLVAKYLKNLFQGDFVAFISIHVGFTVL